RRSQPSAKAPLNFLAVVGQDTAEPPARLAVAGTDALAEKSENCRRGDLADDEPRPPVRRGGITPGDLPHLPDALEVADVNRIQRQQIARLGGRDVPTRFSPAAGALG